MLSDRARYLINQPIHISVELGCDCVRDEGILLSKLIVSKVKKNGQYDFFAAAGAPIDHAAKLVFGPAFGDKGTTEDHDSVLRIPKSPSGDFMRDYRVFGA